MSEIFQQISVLIGIVAAAAYLFKHYYDKHRAKTGCASCKLMQITKSPRSKQRAGV